MGYWIEQRDSNFLLPEANHEKALKALQELAKKAADGEVNSLDWIAPSAIIEAKTIKEALVAIRWEPSIYDETGDVIGLEFTGQKSGSDLQLFNAIAPFVEAGSYIEMQGEDGAVWRWVFDKGRCTEKYGRVVFDY